jgi:uncharacterized protein YkwD
MKNLIIILSILISILSYSQTELDLKILNLVNEYRIENSLKPLVWDTIVVKVSGNQVDYMSTTGHLVHDQLEEDSVIFKVTKTFEEKFTNKGIDFRCFVFENCAVVFNVDTLSLNQIANYVVDGWKKSPIHNEIMLDPKMTNVGISHKKGNIYKEDGIDEFGELYTTTTKCEMEWFSLNGYGRK